MELSAVIDKREKLQSDIIKLMTEFTKDTGLQITELSFFKPIPYTGGFEGSPYYCITVKVEI